MGLSCISVSHKNVCLSELEKFSHIDADYVHHRLKELGIPGLVLRTCHRVELYWHNISNLSADGCVNFASQILEINLSEIPDYMYVSEDEAVHHLAEVCCGLESAIVGEYEILGQVRKALEQAEEHGALDDYLSSLLQMCIKAGVSARKETDIAKGSVSIGSVAVDVIRNLLGDKLGTMVIIGAGKVAGLLGKALSLLEIDDIVWMNRTYERSIMMTERFKAHPVEFNRQSLRSYLQIADAVILATGCPRQLILEDDFNRAQRTKPLILLDLGNPRNVSPDVANIEWVKLIDLDGIKEWISKNTLNRESEIPRVKEIIDKSLLGWQTQLKRNQFEKEIAGIYKYAEDIRKEQLNKTMGSNGFSKEHYEKLDLMSKAITKQILDSPIRNIRFLASKMQNEDAQKLLALFLSDYGSPNSSDESESFTRGQESNTISTRMIR